MVLGEGKRQLTEQIVQQKETIADLNGEIAHIRPFAAVAEEMHRVFTRLNRQAAENPTGLPTDLYQAAVDTVRSSMRTRVVGRATARIMETRGGEIEEEVLRDEGPAIVEAEEKRFAQQDEPSMRTDTAATVRRRLIEATRTRLRRERPQEIRDAFIAEHGPSIEAAERKRFADQEESGVRADAERKARQEITGTTRAALREKIFAEEREKALEAAEAEERFKVRTERIATNAKRTRSVPLTELESGDVIIVNLTEAFSEDRELDGGTRSGRTLRFRVDSPEEGTVHVMGDSWETGGPLSRLHAFRSGTLLAIGSAMETPQGVVAGKVHPVPEPSITYSVPLRVISGGEDKTLATFDVRSVKIDTTNGQTTLLDRANSDMRRY